MDLTQKYPDYYAASDSPEIIILENAHYLSILGKGSPGTDIFYEKKSAIKSFMAKLQSQVEATDKEFKSSIIEIFYWHDKKEGFVDIGNFYTTLSLDLLNYRIVMRIPENITQKDISETAENSPFIPLANEFERFSYATRKCVQLMHSGPFIDELRTLPLLQKFATDKGLVNVGMHHEIHITPFEKGQDQTHLKTILRDAVN
ncbi:MAG: hypothetical protein WBP46_13025 [Thiolinea sp.]